MITNETELRKLMTESVRDHEHYITDGGEFKMTRQKWGDQDHAEYELIETARESGLEEELDAEYDDLIETVWFPRLVVRQARCNYYESC